MSQEIELKLTLPRSSLGALRRHPLFVAAAPVGPRQTLVNTYFDTPDLLLKSRRVALRTRKQGRQWLQTIKCGGEFAGGLAHRPEWEHPYREAFDFGPVDDPQVKALLEAHKDQLQPLFTTTFRRETRRHAPAPGVEILMMLDTGQVEAADRRLPLCELELELAAGKVEDLFQLAVALAGDLPLVPEDMSKAQRGYQLFLHEPSRPMKALPSRVQAQDSPVEAFRTLALDCVRQWQANANAAASNPDPEFIHQMRVALRRLRSLLKIMDPALPAEFVEEWDGRLKAEANRLGNARDLDVLLETVLGPAEAAIDPPVSLAALRHTAEAARQVARAEALASLAKGVHGQALLAFTATLHQLSSDALDRSADLTSFGVLQLKRLTKRARRRLEEAHNQPGIEGLHALRVALKRLRYGLEFFLPLCAGKPARRWLDQLTAVQDGLGYLHDLEVAQRHFQDWRETKIELREAAAFVTGWHARRASRLAVELPDSADRLLGKRLPLKTRRSS